MKKDEASVLSKLLRRAEENPKEEEKRRMTGEGQMTEAWSTRETRGEAKGQKAHEGPRKKHDTAGPDLEALEGDIPDSCRHAWIILGPLLARGPLPPQKTG